ncbi:hypothetical protein KQI74_20910 [Paenibacillus barcinonensis]|uniref:hypothetical protein n=1 Tax=Paenibacillus barcinonensis TaxID=198119 RepID=UPI001C11C7AE|nr:hypothetical protein [Paenibacillus barcinonensis]MBU5354761.1 hypothetical protein [Paenibacillus barcinonensis]
MDWNPFLKGHIPVAKANASLLQLKSFPPPVFKLVDEAIKAQAYASMKPGNDVTERLKIIGYSRDLRHVYVCVRWLVFIVAHRSEHPKATAFTTRRAT